MNDKFKITIASDGEHERVFAELYYGEKFVALVSQEKDGVLEIEFPSAEMDPSMILRKIDLSSFQAALISAALKLTVRS